MRIISGKLKGKSVAFIKTAATRPLKDSVKENIFNIIAHSNLLNINLKNSNIALYLDGFAGDSVIGHGYTNIYIPHFTKNKDSLITTKIVVED